MQQLFVTGFHGSNAKGRRRPLLLCYFNTSVHNWYVRIVNFDNNSNFIDYEMNPTYGGTGTESRDWYTSYNSSNLGFSHGIIRTYIASGSSPANPVVSIKYLELQTLDVFN